MLCHQLSRTREDNVSLSMSVVLTILSSVLGGIKIRDETYGANYSSAKTYLPHVLLPLDALAATFVLVF